MFLKKSNCRQYCCHCLAYTGEADNYVKLTHKGIVVMFVIKICVLCQSVLILVNNVCLRIRELALYLIRLGAVGGQGDWMKIGSSQNMPNRLLAHLRDIKHERCEVLHLTARGGHWKTVEGFEALINGRLRNEITELFGEEYFACSEPAVIRAIELMENPQLLFDDLLDLSA